MNLLHIMPNKLNKYASPRLPVLGHKAASWLLVADQILNYLLQNLPVSSYQRPKLISCQNTTTCNEKDVRVSYWGWPM